MTPPQVSALDLPAYWKLYHQARRKRLVLNTIEIDHGGGLVAEQTIQKTTKRQIDVFSAGCATCNRTIEMVAKLAATEGYELRIHDMHQEHVARRADELGIRSIPAVAVVSAGNEASPGEFAPLKAMALAACCANRGPDEADVRAALASS